MVTLIWKWEFEMETHPIMLMVHYSFTTKEVKFRLYRKDHKWGKKWIFINWGCLTGSLWQFCNQIYWDFEDGLWIGNHLKAQNGLQRVCTVPGVQPGVVHTHRFLQGQTEFQYAWVHVAALC